MSSLPRRGIQWLFGFILGHLQRLLLAILASGPIPDHIAFVMDGNRRYAGKKGKPTFEGHYDGFFALRRMLEFCMRLRVRSVTVYAFAIENFKRSPAEVESLMNLCEEKLNELCEQGELLEQYGVRLQVLGKINLLPERVKEAIKKAEAITINHDKAILNVMMPYASREELTTAVQSTVQRALNGDINPEDITEDDVDAELYTNLAGNGPVEVLIRTSGVKRLSDYLTWQCCENTQIHFTPTYWPDLGLRDFVPILLDYQRKIWSRRLLLSQ
ncbi:Di-trans-poly-cis-decaprenylcistransferase [Ramaria rubella]|nr:Di-trans-poly-cis-decaprenylcistransferase [Ramaria rubella]